MVWRFQCNGLSAQPSWVQWGTLVHSSVRPTTYLMLRRVKLLCKLPIWPELLKLWKSFYSTSLLGPFPLFLFFLWIWKTETAYLHMNWCDKFASIDEMAQVLPCVLYVNEQLFSLCQYMGRNQCIEGGDMTQTEAVWNNSWQVTDADVTTWQEIYTSCCENKHLCIG